MKKHTVITSVLLSFMIVCLFPLTALANSSWVWISETRPLDVLPWVVIVTLLVETLAIIYIAKIRKLPKVLGFVVVSNLCSFAAPYLFVYLGCLSEQLYTFSQTLEHTPFYTVGIGYLLMTLIVEVPFVYAALREEAEHKTRLVWVIVGANVLTTLITAITERVFCQGSW